MFGLVGLAISGSLLGMMLHGGNVRRSAPPLPRLGRLPDFSLTDHEGHPISRTSLAGSVWIADFIFTRCAGQCPMMSAQMATLQQELKGLRGVRFVSFTVDPSYDTPERLAAYAAHYGANPERWRFVTGEPSAIITLVQHGFRLAIGADGTPQEPITHSVRLVLVDQRGSIRGYYDATDARAMAQLKDDARHLAHQH